MTHAHSLMIGCCASMSNDIGCPKIDFLLYTFVFHNMYKYLAFTDINECLLDNGGCDQNCTNLPGSYTCSCTGSFMLDESRQMCNVHILREI